MSVLPDISGHDQLLVLESAGAVSDDELIERIQKTLSGGMALHIYAGRDFIELKRRNPGHFTEIIALRFDQSLDDVEDLMFIAREFPDPSMWGRLPSHKSTLRILARIPREIRDPWIWDDTINVGTTRVVAKELLQKAHAITQEAQPYLEGDDAGDVGGDGGDDAGDAGRAADGDDGDGSDDIGDGHRDRGDDQREDGDHANQELVSYLNIHIRELEARNRELETRNRELEAELTARATQSEIETANLLNRITELDAAAGLSNVSIWHQRRQLANAIEIAQEACRNKNDSARRQLQMDAGRRILEIVQSAKRDGLEIEQLDLVYRLKSEQFNKGQESFVSPDMRGSAVEASN